MTKLFTPDCAFWCRYTATQLNNILEKTGNLDHMVHDVVGDVEASLQMAPFSWYFGVLKVEKIAEF